VSQRVCHSWCSTCDSGSQSAALPSAGYGASNDRQHLMLPRGILRVSESRGGCENGAAVLPLDPRPTTCARLAPVGRVSDAITGFVSLLFRGYRLSRLAGLRSRRMVTEPDIPMVMVSTRCSPRIGVDKPATVGVAFALRGGKRMFGLGGGGGGRGTGIQHSPPRPTEGALAVGYFGQGW